MSTSETWGEFDKPIVVEARETCYKISMEPQRKHRYAWDRWNMAQVHMVLMNRLEATYKNATHIAPNDYANYCQVARDDIDYIHAHHVSEEEFYFPFFAGGKIMEANEKQHADFKNQVEDTLAYLDSVSPSLRSAPPFSAIALRQSMDVWLPTCSQHMSNELSTLSADSLRSAGVTLQQLEKAIQSVAKRRAEEDVRYTLPPMIYANVRGCKFPSDAPWFVPMVLAPACTRFVGGG